jgi:hypothetical protein
MADTQHTASPEDGSIAYGIASGDPEECSPVRTGARSPLRALINGEMDMACEMDVTPRVGCGHDSREACDGCVQAQIDPNVHCNSVTADESSRLREHNDQDMQQIEPSLTGLDDVLQVVGLLKRELIILQQDKGELQAELQDADTVIHGLERKTRMLNRTVKGLQDDNAQLKNEKQAAQDEIKRLHSFNRAQEATMKAMKNIQEDVAPFVRDQHAVALRTLIDGLLYAVGSDVNSDLERFMLDNEGGLRATLGNKFSIDGISAFVL